MWVKDLADLYGIERVVVSAYNPRANGMVERGHKPLIDGLSKMTDRDLEKWTNLLPLILWTDQTTIRCSTGWTPYELLYGYACVLPIEARIPTWTTLTWNTVQTRADLLAIHAEQLLHCDIDLKEAAAHIQ